MTEFLHNSMTMSESSPSILSNQFDTGQIIKHDVNLSALPIPKTDQAIAFVLENIFTREECRALITLAEQNQFSPVSVSYNGKEVVNKNVRSGDRVIIDNEEFTSQLWTRISSLIPVKVKGAQVVGLNERLRFLKYSPDQFFLPHADGNYVRPENSLEMSLLTIQMYLNEEFDGGETTFLAFGQGKMPRVPVKPKTGMALVFSQDLFHEGSHVMNGVKYTVRTDVMYRYGPAQGL